MSRFVVNCFLIWSLAYSPVLVYVDLMAHRTLRPIMPMLAVLWVAPSLGVAPILWRLRGKSPPFEALAGGLLSLLLGFATFPAALGLILVVGRLLSDQHAGVLGMNLFWSTVLGAWPVVVCAPIAGMLAAWLKRRSMAPKSDGNRGDLDHSGAHQGWRASALELRLGLGIPALMVGGALGFVFAYPEYGFAPLFALAFLGLAYLALLGVTLLTGFFRRVQPIAMMTSWAALALLVGFAGMIVLIKLSLALGRNPHALMDVPEDMEQAISSMDKETAALMLLQHYRLAAAVGRAPTVAALQRFANDREIKPQLRREVVSVLVGALSDEDPTVRANAETALIGIGEAAALPGMKLRASRTLFDVVAVLAVLAALFLNTTRS